MDSEYKDLLGRVLTIQSDCEIGGLHLYVERMLPSAPSKVDQLIVARTAAEEIDHFRKIACLAGDIGVDVSFVLSMPNKDSVCECVSRADYDVGRVRRVRLLDRSRRPLSA
jgi:ring-1,2-phenylacetyl-CoA epoxidase subunit PaaA